MSSAPSTLRAVAVGARAVAISAPMVRAARLIAGVAAVALWWRRLVARPCPAVAAALAVAALLAPHARLAVD